MFENAKIILGSFPRVVLLETDRYKIVTVKKVSMCHFSIIDKSTNKRNVYKKVSAFEKALRKNNINKELLMQNMDKIVNGLIDSLDKECATKDDVDFFSIKKALFVPNTSVVLATNGLRSLILKNEVNRNYFEMLYFIKRKNRLIMTARIEVGCTEVFKMAKREDLEIEEIVGKLQDMLREKYDKLCKEN